MRAASGVALSCCLIVLIANFAAASTSAAKGQDRYECPLGEAVNELLATDSAPYHRLMRMAISRVATGGNEVDSAPCLPLRAKEGWWDYEFCWERWVRQFHVENGVVKSEFFLGFSKRAQQLDGDEEYAPKVPRGAPAPPASPVRSKSPLRRALSYEDGVHTATRKLKHLTGVKDWTDSRFTCSIGLDARWKQLTAPASLARKSKKRGSNNNDLSTAVDTAHAMFQQQVVARYFHGGVCGDDNLPRETMVVLACDRQDVELGFNISETTMCRYNLFLFGRVACTILEEAHRVAFASSHGRQKDGDAAPTSTDPSAGGGTAPTGAFADPTAGRGAAAPPDAAGESPAVPAAQPVPGESPPPRTDAPIPLGPTMGRTRPPHGESGGGEATGKSDGSSSSGATGATGGTPPLSPFPAPRSMDPDDFVADDDTFVFSLV